MKCKKCNGIVMLQWRYCPFCAAKLNRRMVFTGFTAATASDEVDSKNFRSTNDNRDIYGIDIMQEGALIEVSGRIADYRGDPVIGTRVSLTQVTDIREGEFSSTNANHWKIPGWNSHYSVVTDNDGIFVINLVDYKENILRTYGLYFQILWQYQEIEIKGEDILQNPAPVMVDLSSQKSRQIDMGTFTARQGGAIKITLLNENNDPIENNAGIYIIKQGETSMDGGQTSGIANGMFISDAYPAGNYSIKIDKDGYRNFVKNGIIINEGQITEVSIKLARKD